MTEYSKLRNRAHSKLIITSDNKTSQEKTHFQDVDEEAGISREAGRGVGRIQNDDCSQNVD